MQILMVAVALWILICILGYLTPKNGILEFYGIATLVGFVMGGIQSVSRSTYAKLMPDTHDTTSFFSFFDVTEKIAIVIGMFSFGLINQITGSQRNSIFALILFFVAGGCILFLAMKRQKETSR
jgi:UMF1 family MFS transporter